MNLQLFQSEPTEQEMDYHVTKIEPTAKEIFSNHIHKGQLITWHKLKEELSRKFFIPLEELKIEGLRKWFERITKLSFLERWIFSTSLDELIIHNQNHIQISEGLIQEDYSINEISSEDYEMSLMYLALSNNITWNYAKPFASFLVSFHDKELLFRATIVHKSLSPTNSSKLFLRAIRRKIYPRETFFLEHQIEHNLILDKMLKEKSNILISGSTASGKTTLLKSMISELSSKEHLVILEDTHEIMPPHNNTTNLIANDDLDGRSLDEYCAYALRMKPDRILLGEIRSKEIIPFILAMNTGHKGLMATLHANSARDALQRAALLFCLYHSGGELSFSDVLKLICQNIDYVIHLSNRKVTEIIKVYGAEKENPLIERICMNEV
ncbi:MAG: CpaF/VirB11 family protein [Bacteriovoracia bacterium]